MDEKPRIKTCPNCGFEFTRNFCPNCGQSKKNLNRPFGEIMKDFLDALFSFDTRFFKTFIPLLLKPGFLTSEYIAGKRNRYFPPFRLFLFVSIVLFALITISGRNIVSNLFSENVVVADSAIAGAIKNRGIIEDQEPVKLIKDTIYVKTRTDTHAIEFVYDLSKMDRKEQMIKSLEEAKDSIMIESWLDSKIISGFIDSLKQPEYFWTTLLKRASQGMFVLLPVFALILRLLYIRSRRYYIQHFVFSSYFHAFAFIVLSLIVFISILLEGWPQKIANYLLLGIPVYLFFGMRRFYGQSFVKTFFKFFMLSVIYNFILVFIIIGIFIITLVMI
jgi:hypothetical protein